MLLFNVTWKALYKQRFYQRRTRRDNNVSYLYEIWDKSLLLSDPCETLQGFFFFHLNNAGQINQKNKRGN